MEKFTFFNDIDNDRVYYAEDFARHLATFFTNGIFNNGCVVKAENSDMSVNVEIGSANINGYRYDNDSTKKLSIENADGVLNRIDNVVIRWDLTNRMITTQVIKGTFAEEPTPPALERTSTIFDLRIAKISIPAGTTEITQDLVTDTRFFNSDCGNVVATIETPNTEDLFISYYKAFEKKLSELDGSLEYFNKTTKESLEKNSNLFDEWFTNLKDKLDGNTATKLQNEIDKINGKFFVEDKNYVHTDNNYSYDEKEKVNKAYASILKAYTITLLAENWTLNTTTNLYEYNVIKEDITENTYIRVIGDSVNREKLSDLDVNSYDGYYILTTTDEPKENVDVTVYYQLTVSANTVDNSAENTDNVDAGGVDNVGEE